MNLQWKYIASVAIGIAASYCGNFPTETKYIDSLNKLNDNSDFEDWKLTFFSAQWSPSFIYFLPLIIGYLVDIIGVLPMLVPLHFMLTLGQIFLTILTFTNNSESKNELLALLGYLFISFSYEGIQLLQKVFLINTFISQNKDTHVYQKVVLVSYALNETAAHTPRMWRLKSGGTSTDMKFGFALGCLLAVLGMVNCIMLSRASWSSENMEASVDEGEQSEIVEPLNRSSGNMRKTFSHLNMRGPSIKSFYQKKPLMNCYVALVVLGCGGFEYLFETIFQYWINAFSNPSWGWDAQAWYSYIAIMISCATCIFFAVKTIKKGTLEKLIICTCVLLLLLIVLSNVKILGLILYVCLLISYPSSIQLYLPYLCNMEFERLGLFLGFFNWIKAIVYVTEIGIGSIPLYGKNLLNNLLNFEWGYAYHDYVAFPLSVLIVLTIAIYGIKKKFFDTDDDFPSLLQPEKNSVNM